MVKKSENVLIADTLSAMRDAFKDRWSLIVTALITIVSAIRVPWGIIDLDSKEVASSVFQVAGTIVALVLPAAAISQSFVTKIEEDVVGRILQEGTKDPNVDIYAIMNVIADKAKENLYPAWRASVYALCSFILATIGMITTPINVQIISSYDFSFNYLLMGASLGFLITASFWFFPSAWYAFRLKTLDDITATFGRLKIEGSAYKASQEQQDSDVMAAHTQSRQALSPPSNQTATDIHY